MSGNESCEEYVLGLYKAMLVDIADVRPELLADCKRDYKRLLSAIECHGLPFFLETMPAFTKHFDQCLANGHLTRSGLTHFRPFKRKSPVPRLFKGLVLRVFDVHGVLRSSPDAYCIKAIRQLSSAVKKLRMQCPDSSTWKQVDEYFRIDSEVRQGSLNWDSGDFSSDSLGDLRLEDLHESEPEPSSAFADEGSAESRSISTQLLEAIQSTADRICAEIGCFSASDWAPRHGPGAVADLRSGEYKYSFPTWPAKLERTFPLDLFGFANFGHWVSALASGAFGKSTFVDSEVPAKLIAVPKTFSAPRLIAAEPTSHQWCQQTILRFLTSRIKETSIRTVVNFHDQTPNQVFAREASRTGSHSTIDLSNASDRISCWLVERMFRKLPSLVDGFYSVRTRWIHQDLDKKVPQLFQLRKFSTMGSAVTFPVQTIIFSMIVVGCILYHRKQSTTFANIRKAAREVRVFGDDMIVPIDVHDDVVAALTHLGLKVNPAKTFSTGKFRESCGYDAYDGIEVSKVSIMAMPLVSKPEAVLSSLDVHNNLFKEGWYETAKFVRSTVESLRRYAFRTVPPDSGATGWWDFEGLGHTGLRTRYNSFLHRLEVRLSVPQGTAKRTPVDSDAMLLQYFTEVKSIPDNLDDRLGKRALRAPLKLRWSWAPAYPWQGGGKPLRDYL